MILLLLLALIAIYIQFGLFVSFQILCWIIVLYSSNLLIESNPNSRELYIIRIMSIIVIVFILYINSKHSSILSAFILPLSIDRITYFEDLKYPITIDDDIKTDYFYLFKVNEISDFLNKFEMYDNYICTIKFIPDISNIKDTSQLILSKPFVINKFSSASTMSKFIDERLLNMVDYYYLDDTIINNSGIVVLVRYTKFYL